MSQIKIYHHRDHNNGGKFDGNCAVDTMRPFGTLFLSGIRCRFRIEEISSGLGTIWGVGIPASNNQYALKVIEDSGEYYLRVRYLNVDYDLSDFKINGDDIYEFTVKMHLGDILMYIYDRYHNLLYSKTVISTSTGSISTDNPYLGGSNSILGIIEGFHGYIFDWDCYYETSDATKYVFYKNYNSVADDVVADFFENYDGDIIGTQPADFWPERIDISGKLKKGSSAIIKQSQDKFRVQLGTSLNLNLFKYSDIKVNDTIEIQINDDVDSDDASIILNVTEIKNKIYSVTNIICEDIHCALKYVTAYNFASPIADYPWYIVMAFWWSTSPFPELEDYKWEIGVNKYISLKQILSMIIGLLQYDNLFAYEITDLLTTDSRYRFLDGTEQIVYYSHNLFHLGMIQESGCSDSTEEKVEKMYPFFKAVLNALRLTYYFEDGNIKYTVLTYGNVEKIKYFDKETEKIRNYKFYQIEAEFISNYSYRYPDMMLYYGAIYDSSDLVTVIANNIDNNFKLEEKDLIINNKLITHFWVFRRETSSYDITYIQNNDVFIDQYVSILDADLRGLKEFEEIKVRLTEDNSANYHLKEDDLIKRISKIKQESS